MSLHTYHISYTYLDGIGSKPVFTIDPMTIDTTSTSLTLPGHSKTNYGEFYNKNLIQIMENFSAPTPPANPTIGQQWFQPFIVEISDPQPVFNNPKCGQLYVENICTLFDNYCEVTYCDTTYLQTNICIPGTVNHYYDCSLKKWVHLNYVNKTRVYVGLDQSDPDSVYPGWNDLVPSYYCGAVKYLSKQNQSYVWNCDTKTWDILNKENVRLDGNNTPMKGILKLVSLTTIETSSDPNTAVSKAWAVRKAGDKMTGLLTLSGNPTADMHAVPKKWADTTYVNAGGDTMTGTLSFFEGTVTGIPYPVSDTDAVPKKWLENMFVKKTGDTVSGTLKFTSGTVTGIADPISDTDVVPKKWATTTFVNAVGDTMTGTLTFTEGTVTGLANPVSDTDAVPKKWADTSYVKNTGDTMTGLLTLSGDPTADLHAVPKRWVETFVAKTSGSTMQSGASITFDGGTIKGLPTTPVDDTDATSKAYVDSEIRKLLVSGTGSSSLAITAGTDINLTTTSNIGEIQVNVTSGTFVRRIGDTMTGDLTFSGGKTVTGIRDPSADTDAVPKKWILDQISGLSGGGSVTNYVSKSGDTMTGDLTFSGGKTIKGIIDPVNNTDAANKQWVVSQIDSKIVSLNSGSTVVAGVTKIIAGTSISISPSTGTGEVTINASLTNGTNYVLKAGDTMTGNLAFSNSARITGLSDPINSTDAATKQWVLAQITSSVGSGGSSGSTSLANYVLKAGDSMTGTLNLVNNANLTLSGGSITGLPYTPISDNAAVSKKWVIDTVADKITANNATLPKGITQIQDSSTVTVTVVSPGVVKLNATASSSGGSVAQPSVIVQGAAFSSLVDLLPDQPWGDTGKFTVVKDVGGAIKSFGDGKSGQLGSGETSTQDYPRAAGFYWTSSAPTDVEQICLSGNVSYLRTTSGKVFATGNNDNGQLGLGDKTTSTLNTARTLYTQVTMPNNDSITHIASSGVPSSSLASITTFFVSATKVYASGSNAQGQAGLANKKADILSPTQVFSSKPIAKVVPVYRSTFLLATDGTVWGCGENDDGQLAQGDNIIKETFVQCKTGSSAFLTGVTKLHAHTGAIVSGTTTTYGTVVFAITSDGKLWAAGYNGKTRAALTLATTVQSTNYFVQVAANITEKIVDVSIGGNEITGMLVTETGKVYSWGYNKQGQAGLGNTTTYITTPTLVSTWAGLGAPPWQTKFKQFYASKNQSPANCYILTTDGQLFGTGNNTIGELGPYCYPIMPAAGKNYTSFTPIFNINLQPSEIATKFVILGQGSTIHILVKTNMNRLFATGGNDLGQVGLSVKNTNLFGFCEVKL